jgi:hypothetical protein
MPATPKKKTASKTATKKAARKTAVKKPAKKSTRGCKGKNFNRATFDRILTLISQNQMKTLDAVRSSGFSHATFYDWIKRQDAATDTPELFESLKRAQMDRDIILNQGKLEEAEAELKIRGVDGWEEPVFHNGELCGTKRKYSDTCLIFMLKALDPAKYREAAQVEIHNQVNGGPLPTQGERKKMEADLADMVRGLQAAAARGKS